jgi:hypothetical protein
MNLSRTVATGLLAAGLALSAARAAHAATGILVTPFSFGATFDRFDAFDPSLGTLRSVRFDLFGQFEPLILSDVAAVGATETLFLSQTFTGFAGRGFTSISSPTITGTMITNGLGAAEIAIAPFTDSFKFDAASEITGFALDTYGEVLGAHLSDFLAGGPSGGLIDEIPSYSAYALSLSGATLPSIDTVVEGGGLVTYVYKLPDSPPPPPPPPGGAAPEPAAWALLLAGFALAGARLRGRASAPTA